MTSLQPVNTPLVLLIRDGWGENPNREHDSFNAVRLARTPVAERLMAEYPTTLIHTSGEDVGVPEGTTGNSEVGHQNLGAGRIVNQDSVRISQAIRDESFFTNEVFLHATERIRQSGRHHLHLLGICSDAGVHGRLEHLYALFELCRREGLRPESVCVHLFTDGRDTGPFTGVHFVEQVEGRLAEIGVGRVASVMGRYWAMDRDNRWERIRRAWDCLTWSADSTGPAPPRAKRASDAVQEHYDHPPDEQMRGDEFVTPTMVGASDEDAMSGRIDPGDIVIFYNYRGDRPRQLVRALAMPEFHGHVRPSPDTGQCGFNRTGDSDDQRNVHVITMCEYEKELNQWVKVAYPKPPRLHDIVGEYLSRLGLTQFRCAETEKYAHVTFFFNDYRDEPFEGEHRQIIQSPRVSTYDQQPEMSAAGVRDAVLARLAAEDCEDFLIVNFANADMVGHTGKLDAAIRAVETVDACVGAIVDAALRRGGSLIVTADHGNAEQMFDPATMGPHTAHTMYDVPLIIVGEGFKGRVLRTGGRLADVMPTAFDMTGIDVPAAMTGRSLLE
ncbi:MAG: 2,3-bisphosphoglycerate-independent phosphoglycerate mutase [Phycisphaerales bacterium]|nr:2,3-bisphosphoglycerate-independent phosphoglycerate mutase [Phycisphaerales bacterium]